MKAVKNALFVSISLVLLATSAQASEDYLCSIEHWEAGQTYYFDSDTDQSEIGEGWIIDCVNIDIEEPEFIDI